MIIERMMKKIFCYKRLLTFGCILVLLGLVSLGYLKCLRSKEIVEFLPQTYPTSGEIFITIPGSSTYRAESEDTVNWNNIYDRLSKTKIRKKYISKSVLTQMLRYSIYLYFDELEKFEIVYYPDANFVEIYYNVKRIGAGEVLN